MNTYLTTMKQEPDHDYKNHEILTRIREDLLQPYY